MGEPSLVHRLRNPHGHSQIVMRLEAADRIEALEARCERLEEALEPIGDTKAAYMGEFAFTLTRIDECGDEYPEKVYVPWTTIKDIMAAIRARAALEEAGNGRA